MRRLHNLKYHIEVPSITAERLNAMFGGIPTLVDEQDHQNFTHIVKLEPFQRALDKFKPQLWISGIRKVDNETRKHLNVLSIDKRGIYKVSPLFHWTDQDMQDYMQSHQLPTCRHYYDPTKVETGRECGLPDTLI